MGRGLRSITDLVSEVIARQGIGEVQAREAREKVWREIVDEQMRIFTALGKLSRGCLYVIVADAVTLQELAFRQAALLEQLQARLPDQPVRRLTFRIGAVDSPDANQ